MSGYAEKEHATVYQITNLVNGDFYIGVSRFRPENRWTQHRYNAIVKRLRTYFYNAIRKYGPEKFSLVPICTVLRKSEWSATEREIIGDRHPPYNQTNGGEITIGRRASRETIARIRAANLGQKRTPEQNAANSARLKAFYAAQPEQRQLQAMHLARLRVKRWADPQQRRKLSEWAKEQRLPDGFIAKMGPKIFSATTRAKLSAALKGREMSHKWREKMARAKHKPIECITYATVFDCAKDAAELTGVSITSVRRVCKGQSLHAKGLRFSYQENAS